MPMFRNPGRLIGEFTWAQLYALTGMANGDEAVVTDIPAGGARSYWYYDSTAGRWRVFAPTLIAVNTALITGLAQTAVQYLGGLTVPAGILAGATVGYRLGLGKTGTTDAFGTSTAVRIGPGTTSDVTVMSTNIASVLSAANRSYGLELFLRFTGNTTTVRLGTGAGSAMSFANTGSSGPPNAAITVPDVTTTANVVGSTTTMGGTTDSPQVSYQALILHP